jgi:hypothetical protein
MNSPPSFPPLYCVKRGNFLKYNVLHIPLFTRKQRGGYPERSKEGGEFVDYRAKKSGPA